MSYIHPLKSHWTVSRTLQQKKPAAEVIPRGCSLAYGQGELEPPLLPKLRRVQFIGQPLTVCTGKVCISSGLPSKSCRNNKKIPGRQP